MAELGSLESVADAGSTSSVYLSQVKHQTIDRKTGKPRQMGGAIARRLEVGCNKPKGWMDKDHAAANITLPGFSVTATASNQTPALIAREKSPTYLVENIYPAKFSIPLLSWVRAGAFCEAPGQFTREDAEELLPRPLFRTGPNTFALTVVGDSMDAPSGYREGEIVYIDPDIEPTPGKDVLAKADGKMTLKRYKVDEEGPYLLQLNGSRIIRPTGEWHVCGVVVYAGRRC